jgi:hypothetical protein
MNQPANSESTKSLPINPTPTPKMTANKKIPPHNSNNIAKIPKINHPMEYSHFKTPKQVQNPNSNSPSPPTAQPSNSTPTNNPT